MFTLENTSNEVKFHVIIIKQILNVSRSRAKVMAPALAPAKYPGSGRLRLRNPDFVCVQLYTHTFVLIERNFRRTTTTIRIDADPGSRCFEKGWEGYY